MIGFKTFVILAVLCHLTLGAPSVRVKRGDEKTLDPVNESVRILFKIEIFKRKIVSKLISKFIRMMMMILLNKKAKIYSKIKLKLKVLDMQLCKSKHKYNLVWQFSLFYVRNNHWQCETRVK